MKKTIVSLILAAALSTSLFSSASWAAASDAGEKASAQSRLSEGEVSNGSLETDTGSLALPVDEVEEEIINHFHTNETEKLWLNEQHLPDYAMDFYSILVRESEEEHLKTDVLVLDSSFELDDETNEHVVTEVTLVEEVDYEEPFYLAAREIPVTGDTLGEEHIYVLDATLGDESIDYRSLSEGSLVKTAAFNGICITSLTKTGNSDFDRELDNTRESILAAYRAFDRTHPEVFWLSGKTKLRIEFANLKSGGQTVQKAYFFYVLADSSGFTVRDSAYAGSGAIQAGVHRRDTAIRTILASLPKSGPESQVKAVNAWLTQHNEYNTSSDLNTIGIDCRHCLGALTGSVGTKGPVCEGYSKAFKVLCDQLGVPCLLETGYAGTSSGMGMHMWDLVEMPDGMWYGADITWDDPIVSGKSGAVSGMENEKYLLVGNNTVIDRYRFGDTHQADKANQYPQLAAEAYVGGTALENAPVPLSGLPAAAAQPAPGLPFSDVPAGTYYADAVRWALKKGVTTGTSANTFSPGASCSRGQVVTFLWRAMGQPAPKSSRNPFRDVKNSDYFQTAILWAVEQGITTGTSAGDFSPKRTCTRAEVLTFLWRAMGKPENKGSSVWYADAVNWAERNGLLAGTSQAFNPGEACPRADIVTYLYHALNR